MESQGRGSGTPWPCEGHTVLTAKTNLLRLVRDERHADAAQADDCHDEPLGPLMLEIHFHLRPEAHSFCI